jgi:hypothetical protein
MRRPELPLEEVQVPAHPSSRPHVSPRPGTTAPRPARRGSPPPGPPCRAGSAARTRPGRGLSNPPPPRAGGTQPGCRHARPGPRRRTRRGGTIGAPCEATRPRRATTLARVVRPVVLEAPTAAKPGRGAPRGRSDAAPGPRRASVTPAPRYDARVRGPACVSPTRTGPPDRGVDPWCAAGSPAGPGGDGARVGGGLRLPRRGRPARGGLYAPGPPPYRAARWR